ncbi:MAG TPA: hypothetical protein VLX92_08290 [Kofleriaceae bacterium]|nr:hypothetical protein [Kofleriaceae bacterium]
MALVACSDKSATSNQGPSSAPPPVSAANYPDWAAAVVPPYPNATVAIPVNTNMYQLQTTDEVPVVLDWYKAHSHATWTNEATSATTWHGAAGSVTINISRNDYNGPNEQAKKIKTMISLDR